MKKIVLGLIGAVALNVACTDLEEPLTGVQEESGLTPQEIVDGQINTAKLALRSFQQTDFQYVLHQHPTDEMAGPTRGSDWDDGGAWRALHLHEWNSNHPRIIGAFDQVFGGMFASIDALSNGAAGVQEAEAKFLLAFWMFQATDLWGRIPFREPGSDYADLPTILERTEAIDRAINELEPVYQNLPATNDPAQLNRYAAAMLLAKMYLNRAVYKATDADGTPQAGPFTFDNADMQKVVQYSDEVIGGGFSLQSQYFDIFAPDNTNIGTEAVFVSENDNNLGGELRRLYFMTLHYNQNPSSWNGFVALTDLYNKFENGDPRKESNLATLSADSGLKGGFQVGPQVDAAGDPVFERGQGAPQLNYTPTFTLANSGESEGVRVVKYQPDYSNIDRPANDYVIFRLADAYLMKAEAMERMGQSGAMALQDLWTARGVDALYSDTSLQGILDERSRELYWEGWRRQDQIRFGTFLDPVQEKPMASDRTKLVYPIPATAVSTNPDLNQNPGY